MGKQFWLLQIITIFNQTETLDMSFEQRKREGEMEVLRNLIVSVERAETDVKYLQNQLFMLRERLQLIEKHLRDGDT